MNSICRNGKKLNLKSIRKKIGSEPVFFLAPKRLWIPTLLCIGGEGFWKSPGSADLYPRTSSAEDTCCLLLRSSSEPQQHPGEVCWPLCTALQGFQCVFHLVMYFFYYAIAAWVVSGDLLVIYIQLDAQCCPDCIGWTVGCGWSDVRIWRTGPLSLLQLSAPVLVGERGNCFYPPGWSV